MSFRLYVGNYPFDLSEEDVKKLFRDFEGLTFDKEVRKEPKKCYSFFACNDMDLLVSVIQKMHNMDVRGRSLIVRATDHSLQDYVDILLKETDKSETDKSRNSEPPSPLVPTQVMKRSTQSNLEREQNGESTSSSVLNNHEQKYRQPTEDKSSYRASHGSYRQNRMKNFKDLSKQVSPSSPTSLQDYQNGRKSSDDKSSPINDERNQHRGSKYPNHYDRHLEENAQREEDFDEKCTYRQNCMKNSRDLSEQVSYSSPTSLQDYRNRRKPSDDESSQINVARPQYNDSKYPNNYDRHSEKNAHHEEDFDEWSTYYEEDFSTPETNCESPDSVGTWVSVSNFPFYTPSESIYELFSEYQPHKVFMVCNKPIKRGGGQLGFMMTEAHICFPNQDVVHDVIMNFDNTFYKGRLLLVNDMEDTTVLDELLLVSSC